MGLAPVFLALCLAAASWQACAGRIVQQFIERASPSQLNTGCLATIAPPFELSLP